MSSNTKNLNDYDINSKYNEINFSVLEERKMNVTTNVDFIGKPTSKVIIEKK